MWFLIFYNPQHKEFRHSFELKDVFSFSSSAQLSVHSSSFTPSTSSYFYLFAGASERKITVGAEGKREENTISFLFLAIGTQNIGEEVVFCHFVKDLGSCTRNERKPHLLPSVDRQGKEILITPFTISFGPGAILCPRGSLHRAKVMSQIVAQQQPLLAPMK